MDNIEEATHEVHDDVEEGLHDDVPDLHEPRAVEAVPLDHHDEEVEAGKEGAEDDEGAEHGREADIEKAVEDGAEIYLGDKTGQKLLSFKGSILLGLDSFRCTRFYISKDETL